jgi:hypothetical protein
MTPKTILRTAAFMTNLLLLASSAIALGHAGHPHGAGAHDHHAPPSSYPESQAPQVEDSQSQSSQPIDAQRAAREMKINERYQLEIKPVFEKKCFDCHSSKTTYPWYHQLPGIKQYIDNDIDEAREHIDMEQGFPFKSHATPEEDLKAIADDIEDNDMPPLPYKLMHRRAGLTADEKAKVKAWVQFGLEQLGSSKP